MNVHYHKNFLKHFKLRIKHHPQMVTKFQTRLKLFINDSTNPILKDHQLIGPKSYRRAFSITGDIRVIYQKVEDGVLLMDIGSHNQVY
ncbi:MAG: type II toxin-antitoxin system mRNA interferase toxin, RelE/StbE family [Candidatus Daviesbacteria bacterium]|nr:type II toxin-antitoxin system mRNA interferase toxin, RelE/StbE family [Candidatus Daviesbacteria bacterium]